MAYTGMQRSLTIEVNKTIAGTQIAGYPRQYNGCNEFSHNGVNYAQITVVQMASIQKEVYLSRLAAFTAYVESIEAGLTVATDLIAGTEAYRENQSVCPIT